MTKCKCESENNHKKSCYDKLVARIEELEKQIEKLEDHLRFINA